MRLNALVPYGCESPHCYPALGYVYEWTDICMNDTLVLKLILFFFFLHMSNEHKYLLGSIFHSDCLKFLCYLKRDLGLSCKVLQILAREPQSPSDRKL